MKQEKKMLKLLEETVESHTEDFQGAAGKAVDNFLMHGMLPKDALAVDETTFAGMCKDAYRLYNSGKYQEAAYLFSSLALLDPSEPKYLFGLAACSHMVGEYKQAAEAYSQCAMFMPEDPMPCYHAAECYVQIQEPLSAMVSLQMAVARAGDKKEYAQMKERAAIMMDHLAKQAKKQE